MKENEQKERYGETSHNDKLDGSSIMENPVSLELVLVGRTLAHSSIPNSELRTRRVSRQNQKRLLHTDDPQGLQGVGTSVGIFSDTRVKHAMALGRSVNNSEPDEIQDRLIQNEIRCMISDGQSSKERMTICNLLGSANLPLLDGSAFAEALEALSPMEV